MNIEKKPPSYLFMLGKTGHSVSHRAHVPCKGDRREGNSSVWLETWTLYLFPLASTAAISAGSFFLFFFRRGELLFITILACFFENPLREICEAVGNRVFLLLDYKCVWPVHLSTEWHLLLGTLKEIMGTLQPYERIQILIAQEWSI